MTRIRKPKVVTATTAHQELSDLMILASKRDVRVTKHGTPKVVIVDSDRYATLVKGYKG